MASDELDKAELPALEQLQSLGWSYVEGAQLSPDESDERSSWKDVVLEKRLTESLKRINPWINDENIRKVVRDLTKTIYSNLVEANQAIWTQINQSVSVMQDLGKGNKSQTVHIIDFENIEKQKGKLQDWVTKKNLKTKNGFSYAGYDPPWTVPSLRKNEILIEVDSTIRGDKP